MPLQLSSSSALVTGAGSGINLCFAALLLSKGCNVLIADLSLRPEAQTLIDKHKDGPARAVFQEADVTSWQQLERAVEAGIAAFGSLELFCPGAGVFEPLFSNFWRPPGHPSSRDKPDSDRYASIDINFTHPIRLSQLAISHMLSHPAPSSTPQLRGAIIFVSSVAAQRTALPAPIYAACKAGISSLTRSLAPLEAKHGIRVGAVAPGLVKTPLFLDNAEKLKLMDETKDVWTTPEEVAEAMLEVVMNEKYASGTVLEVGAGNIRVVEMLMDPGPGSSAGSTSSGAQSLVDDVWQDLGREKWGVVSK